MEWGKLFFVVSAAILAWLIYAMIRNKPAAFSKTNLSKSVYTLGILALILIAFIFGLVLLLKG